MRHVITARSIVWLSAMFFSVVFAVRASGAALDADAIAKASGRAATAQPDGVVRIGWPRTDVTVTVDGTVLPPAAGLASWAAFAQMPNGDAMVMGDTVVFADEVDAAMDAAFRARTRSDRYPQSLLSRHARGVLHAHRRGRKARMRSRLQ